MMNIELIELIEFQNAPRPPYVVDNVKNYSPTNTHTYRERERGDRQQVPFEEEKEKPAQIKLDGTMLMKASDF